MNIFKTAPFAHQLKALKLSKDAKAFALLMEQGTGKSKVVIDTIAHLYRKHRIDMVVIIAPKGVAPIWLYQQLPEHMPVDIPYAAALWKSASGMTQQRQQLLTTTLQHVGLRIVIMNVEAFGATEDAIDFAITVLDSAMSAMVVVDESHRIKTPKAHSTKRVLNLRIRSAYRRILTGTVGDKPFDLYSQFRFLDPTILGVDSFAAFRAEYAEMMPDSSGLYRHIVRRLPKKWSGRWLDEDGKPTTQRLDEDGVPRRKEMEPAYKPMIVTQNPDGTPKYRNLDRLQKLIAPHSFRVLKKDCLDLPDKLYGRYYTELAPIQRKWYNQVRDDMRIEWEEGRITTLNKLTVLLRLQQIVCGYVGDGETVVSLFKSWSENPRIVSMLELISDRPEGEFTIIWCRFVEDIRRTSEALVQAYGPGSVVQFYGDVGEKDRAEAVARFQGERQVLDKKGNLIRKDPVPDEERARFMIAQQRAGGVGQTWTAASLSLHYSNTFSLIDRLQAEDRPHRHGQKKTVQYIDMEAEETIDSIIITSLIAKKDVADVINNDPKMEWLR